MPPASAYEVSVLTMRSNPSLRTFVEKNYLDEDFGSAVDRYGKSEEFNALVCALRCRLRGTRPQVLDLGAGRGLTSVALLRAGLQITSLEADASDVVGIGALAQRCAQEGGRAVQGDVLRLPFRSASFDAAICRSVLHHLDDLEMGLREICRILKPGGVFIALGEHIRSLLSDGNRFRAAHPAVSYGVDERAYPLVRYWWSLRESGFHAVSFSDYGHAVALSEFENARAGRWPGMLAAVPAVRRPLTGALHMLHVLRRRYLYWIAVPEHMLPVTNLLAQKPAARLRSSGGP